MSGTTTLGIPYLQSTDNTSALYTLGATQATTIDTLISQKGYVNKDERTTASGTFTTTETVVQSYTFTAVANVRYRVIGIQSVQSTVAGDTVTVRLRWASGASVTSSGTQIDSKIAGCSTVSVGALAFLLGTFVPGAGQVTVGATAVRNLGTGTLSSFANGSQIDVLYVEGV